MAFPKNSNFRVLFSGIIVNIFYLGNGCLLSYPSPAVANINANKNPFRVDSDQQSWIGSLSLLGLLIGSILGGMISDAMGRKFIMMSSAVMCVVGLTVVSSATHVQTMYIGLFVTGLFSGINYPSVFLYSGEIASHDNRGILLSLPGTTGTFGFVVLFTAGAYLPWNWLAIFVASFFAIPPLILVFLPESPRWFLMKGNKEAAAHSLRWFRGKDVDVDEEMDVIEQSLNNAPMGMSAWKDLLQMKNAKPLLLCCILLLVQAFSGSFIMAIFTVTIFQSAKVNIDANLQSVIAALFSFFGSVVCLFLIERCSRCRLLLVSTFFNALGMGMLATFFQVHERNPSYAESHLSWLPLLGLSLSNFMFYVGLFPIPWIFTCELFSTNVRGVVQSLTNAFFMSMSFAAAKSFYNIENALNFSGAFWISVFFGVCGVFFILFVVKEPQRKILD